MPAMCGRGEAVAGAAQRATAEPRDVQLEAAPENSTGGVGL